MKHTKKTVFGLFAASILSAVVVSACYNPEFTPSITSVRFNHTEVSLSLDGNLLGTDDLILSMRPDIATVDVLGEIEWESSLDVAITEFMWPDTHFDSKGEARVKLMVTPDSNLLSTDPESFFISARVNAVDGNVFYAWCKVVVVKVDSH